MSDFAAASGHWYTASGEPAYTIEAKKGGRRATTIRDARALGLCPSVTTILKCAAKPALTNWLVDQALLSALTLPRIDGETLDAFKVRARQDSERQAKEAAEKGSALHASLEAHFKGGMVPSEHIPHVHEVSKALAAAGFAGPWEAERSFACPVNHYGGKLDLSAENCVVDFKSKPRIEDGKKYAYDEHCQQLAAYARGLGRPSATLVNVFVGLADNRVQLHIWTPEEAARGWEMFRLLLAYWKVANNFYPAMEKAA